MVLSMERDDLSIIASTLQKSVAYTLRYKKIAVMVSGGSDSDDMLAVLLKTVPKEKLYFLFCNTGIEMQATLDHLCYLERKYNIKINRLKAIRPVPLCCKDYGQPFLTKYVSAMIERLQRYGFKWENESFDVLYNRYPNCKVALQWWCNKNGDKSRFNISRNLYLKEFMLENPPMFRISPKCCKFAKKDVGKEWIINNNADMHCMGIRRAENGVRSQMYKNCFTYKSGALCQEYRPIFYFTDNTKAVFEKLEGIKHSQCYSLYGLYRSGCAGCPFGSNFEYEIKILQQYEPRLYMAINNIFSESYSYTRRYKIFKETKRRAADK